MIAIGEAPLLGSRGNRVDPIYPLIAVYEFRIERRSVVRKEQPDAVFHGYALAVDDGASG